MLKSIKAKQCWNHFLWCIKQEDYEAGAAMHTWLNCYLTKSEADEVIAFAELRRKLASQTSKAKKKSRRM